MKTSLKIALLCVALAVMTACSAQKRAERRVRRAIIECPELVQMKAHPIDTVLTAPAFADVAIVPMQAVETGDTIYAATPHGTVVVSLQQHDSTLRVGFVAAPREIHYQDTLRYAQVAINPVPKTKPKNDFFSDFAVGCLCVAAGFVLALYLIFRKEK